MIKVFINMSGVTSRDMDGDKTGRLSGIGGLLLVIMREYGYVVVEREKKRKKRKNASSSGYDSVVVRLAEARGVD